MAEDAQPPTRVLTVTWVDIDDSIQPVPGMTFLSPEVGRQPRLEHVDHEPRWNAGLTSSLTSIGAFQIAGMRRIHCVRR